MEHNEQGFLSLGPHGFHRIYYTHWGDVHNRDAVICVHGLTRNCRDFDSLAADLASDFRIACPDLPGRGFSHWLNEPNDYGMAVYMNDMSTLISRLGVDHVHWVGTSLGGLIGMLLAAQPNSPIHSLVVNDIGPFVPSTALQRIGEYVGRRDKFTDFDSLKSYLMNVHADFGNLSDEQWTHLASCSGREEENGNWRLHYDPDIAIPFNQAKDQDVDLWDIWDAVNCPVLVVRGEQSDVLPRETANEMLKRGPVTDLIEFPNTGHAPALMDENQVDAIRSWLVAHRI